MLLIGGFEWLISLYSKTYKVIFTDIWLILLYTVNKGP